MNELTLDRDTPYGIGDPMRLVARFPRGFPDEMAPVKVSVQFRPPNGKETRLPDLTLVKLDGIEYEATIKRAREGTYRFLLTHPDPALLEPKGQPPHAEVKVDLLVGDAVNLGMNARDMKQAAEATQGTFFPLGITEQFLDMPPAGR